MLGYGHGIVGLSVRLWSRYILQVLYGGGVSNKKQKSWKYYLLLYNKFTSPESEKILKTWEDPYYFRTSRQNRNYGLSPVIVIL